MGGRLSATAVLAVGLALAGPAAAHALKFCVNKPSCAASGGAEVTGGATLGEDLQQALAAAASVDGPDRVEVGEGVYEREQFGFNYQHDDDRLELVGSGQGRTVLRHPNPGSFSNVLRLADNTDDSGTVASDLSIVVTPSGDPNHVVRGLYLRSTSAARVTVRASAAAESGGAKVQAVQFDGDGRLSESTIASTSAPESRAVGIEGGNGRITGSTLTGHTGVRAFDSGDTGVLGLIVLRTRISARHGIDVIANLNGESSSAAVRDSLVLVDSLGGGPQVPFGLGARGDGANLDVDLRRTTIIGDGTPLQRGAAVEEHNGAGVDVALDIDSSVIDDSPVPLRCIASNGDGPALTVAYSNVDLASSNVGACQGAPATTEVMDVPPRFVDAAGGDFHLRFDSPLIDAASPGILLAFPPPTDLDGNPRTRDGDGVDGARRDIGAFEYQRLAPSAVVSGPSGASVGVAVALSGSGSSDPDPGDSLSYEWSFSDGSSASGASVSKTFSQAGTFTAVLEVTDPTGLSDEATRQIVVTESGGPSGDPQSNPSAPRFLAAFYRRLFRVAPRVTPIFSPARIGAAAARRNATAAQRRAIRRGTYLLYRVSEPVLMVFYVRRVSVGRRFRGNCLPAFRVLVARAAPRCLRAVLVGRLGRIGRPGRLNALAFSGRIGAVRLPAGYWVMTMRARDAQRNFSSLRHLLFRVVAG